MGGRIKRIRNSLNMTMEEFAKAIKVSGKSTVNEWEKDRATPGAAPLSRISNLTNVSEDWLVFGTPSEYVFSVLKKETTDNSTALYKSILTYLENTSILQFDDEELSYDDNGDYLDDSTYEHIVMKEITSKINLILHEHSDHILEKYTKAHSIDVYRKELDIINYATEYFLKLSYLNQHTFEAEYNALKQGLLLYDPSTSLYHKTGDTNEVTNIDVYLDSVKDHSESISKYVDDFYKNKLRLIQETALAEIESVKNQRIEKINELKI